MFFKNRVITLKEARWLCEILSIRAEVYRVDLVVSIETGGWYVGRQIARCLQVDHVPITVRRFADEGANICGSRFQFLRRLCSVIHHGLLRSLRKPRLIKGVDDPNVIKGKRILLVDDAIHTGSTVAVARDYLYQAGSVGVTVVALASVRGFKQPYLCMLEGHHCYPWSKVSPEYDQFLVIHNDAHG